MKTETDLTNWTCGNVFLLIEKWTWKGVNVNVNLVKE
jgi:hypothetical protein